MDYLKELYLKELVNKINEDGYIFTPLNLCEKMVNSISNLSGSILVIRNIEFIFTLYHKGCDMSNVWFMSSCELKGKIAIALGVLPEHIVEMSYNIKELDVNMKFDVIVMNPPYNPNALWKKFVELGISLLKPDGQMIAIHPSAWRESNRHKDIYNVLTSGLTSLHIGDYDNFKNIVRVKTDWYVYTKKQSINCHIYYPNGIQEELDIKNVSNIFRFPSKSVQQSIFKKIFNCVDNGMIAEKGFNELYNTEYKQTGYKQCGGKGRGIGNGWITGDFVYTECASKHQFLSKVVCAYTHKPRAHFFYKDDEVGVLLGNYWLTTNQSLPILLNSKLFWKLYTNIISPDKGQFGASEIPANIPSWYYRQLNFEGLTATTEEEIYEHYGLTQEEINWIEVD